jgi:hypothetical protein
VDERDKIIAERLRLKREYAERYAKLSALLFEADPIGINFGDNTDEYEPEVGTILPRLSTCHSIGDVAQVIYEEFVRWFSPADAGPLKRYLPIAERVWSEVMGKNIRNE